MADLIVLRARLAEAELAYHNLLLGRHSASVGYEGKSVTYTQANIHELAAYIVRLKQEIGMVDGTVPRRQPLHLTF